MCVSWTEEKKTHVLLYSTHFSKGTLTFTQDVGTPALVREVKAITDQEFDNELDWADLMPGVDFDVDDGLVDDFVAALNSLDQQHCQE